MTKKFFLLTLLVAGNVVHAGFIETFMNELLEFCRTKQQELTEQMQSAGAAIVAAKEKIAELTKQYEESIAGLSEEVRELSTVQEDLNKNQAFINGIIEKLTQKPSGTSSAVNTDTRTVYTTIVGTAKSTQAKIFNSARSGATYVATNPVKSAAIVVAVIVAGYALKKAYDAYTEQEEEEQTA